MLPSLKTKGLLDTQLLIKLPKTPLTQYFNLKDY
jgi:hypothetical protein